MSYAYGPDPSKWGQGEDGSPLYAANLRGVEGAILARTSNLYGMLPTDDPFQYLGGISLAVRHLTGKSPSLYISNQRQPGTARIESAARFLATELNTRAFHPGWVRSMQAEGYAGALDLQNMVNNLWGWQVVDPKMVTAAQWQRLHEVYVQDALGLDLRAWFEKNQPEALVRMTERMLEAIRKDYWDAPEATRRELVETWQQLTQKYAIAAGNEKIKAFVEGLAAVDLGLGGLRLLGVGEGDLLDRAGLGRGEALRLQGFIAGLCLVVGDLGRIGDCISGDREDRRGPVLRRAEGDLAVVVEGLELVFRRRGDLAGGACRQAGEGDRALLVAQAVANFLQGRRHSQAA